MRNLDRLGIACLAEFAPCVAAAQSTTSSGGDARWQPAAYAGAWTDPTAEQRFGEPLIGPMIGLELRRRNPKRRANFVATVRGYTKGAGQVSVSFPPPRGDYRQRQDLLTVGLGADWAVKRSAAEWTVGLSVAAATSRITTREITSTGLPSNRFAADPGWGHVTALVVARSGVTLPITTQWGLRVGAEVLQGVETLNDVRPILGAYIGLTLRR